MLVLTRYCGERLIIDDDIKVIVLGVKGNSVRLGIEAPDEVSIMREELYNRGVREVKPNKGESND